jgi:hypothetical protein
VKEIFMLNRFSIRMDDVTVATAVANSGEILCSEFALGMVYVPAGSSLTTLTWYAAEKAGGTYTAAYDELGNAVVQTVAAAKCYQVPVALAGAAALKIVGNAAGTVDVVLKG